MNLERSHHHVVGVVGKGLCECGCGRETNISNKNDTKIGLVRGEPRRFCAGHQTNVKVRDNHKPCSRCKKMLPLSSFRYRKDVWHETHAFCFDCERDYRTYDRKRTPESLRDYNFRKNYGMTAIEVDEMADAQGNVCAICKQPPTSNVTTRKGVKQLVVDHDHDTGRVRALLCHRCNLAVSYIERAPHLLGPWVAYLDAHKET